ncbi:DNA-binding protein RFXANK-like [Panonychus citri]|uniref:DNA-binding protein RFXANK-like n=1 Tax=Panonychus citri TaxID=50023 RepID=UPI002307EE88|nr:DNA-binding protein RFXANK-like [Panonychus citri]
MEDRSGKQQSTNNNSYQMKFLKLNRDGRSAFTPYRPSTILTNLQRGNIKTQSIREIPERTVFELAAQGELYLHHLDAGGVDQVDENGFTVVDLAAGYGQLTTVKMLIAGGANPKVRGKNGESALSFAATNGHVHVLRYLIARDVNVNEYDEEGNTALMYIIIILCVFTNC